jgi:hypothetical protein
MQGINNTKYSNKFWQKGNYFVKHPPRWVGCVEETERQRGEKQKLIYAAQ